jgi:hypothetical protein
MVYISLLLNLYLQKLSLYGPWDFVLSPCITSFCVVFVHLQLSKMVELYVGPHATILDNMNSQTCKL